MLSISDKKLKTSFIQAEILDIPLFFIGFFIPFAGDLVESVIGGIIEMLLFRRTYKRFGEKAFYPLILESIDLTDFATLGVVDILGWIELIPFWLIFFTKFQGKLEETEDSSQCLSSNSTEIKKIREENEPVEKKKNNSSKICIECGKQNPKYLTICEKCGTTLN